MNFRFLLSVFLIGVLLNANAQVNQWQVGVSTGISQFKSTDQLLNSYTYKGIIPAVQLNGGYKTGKNQFRISLFSSIGQTSPIDINQQLYDYNYLRVRNFTLVLKYYREVFHSNKLRLHLGIGYRSNLHYQTEYYKNNLYDYGRGFRKSFAFSATSVSFNSVLTYQPNGKNVFELQAWYAPLSFSARPIDNYVKQLGYSTKPKWELLGGQHYVACQFSFIYKRRIGATLDLKLEGKTRFQYYNYQDRCAYLSNMILLGVEKRF